MDATKKSVQKESWCTARSMLWMVYNMRCDMRTYRPQSDLRGAAIHGVSVECDLSMKASKVVGMIFLEEEGNIFDLEVEVQCIEEVDRVRIMEWKTVKFMTDKGPSGNKDWSPDHE
ncbi:hypothetical protein C5167_008631 [Papaver somniferum]|uniref:Uncharacterized protein n=1 Tax=Papaver somniferum TaxID=3469 RepID=A0A4Y7JY81_PAPSO|nr:hypothetical protein C5167_008631 [Papaver somniferum]